MLLLIGILLIVKEIQAYTCRATGRIVPSNVLMGLTVMLAWVAKMEVYQQVILAQHR